jgi:hypothetical protein
MFGRRPMLGEVQPAPVERSRIDKTDPNDARSAAIVAWRAPGLSTVGHQDASCTARVGTPRLVRGDSRARADNRRFVSVCWVGAVRTGPVWA